MGRHKMKKLSAIIISTLIIIWSVSVPHDIGTVYH